MRQYYVAAVKSLVDYTAPVLVALTHRQARKLEVVQNKAMRPILGAPTWTKVHNLRLETGCPALADRITYRLCAIGARALASGRPSCFSTTLRETLSRPQATQGIHFYAKKVTTHIRRTGTVQVALGIAPHVPLDEATSLLARHGWS